jgi:dUTPase
MNYPDEFKICNHDGVVELLVITTDKLKFSNTYTYIESLDVQTWRLKYIGSHAIDILMAHITMNGSIESLLSANTSYLSFKYSLVHDLAIPPYKKRPSDSGFDLYVININKKIGKVTFYGTGIVVQPPTGYYFDMVPTDNIIQSGYMLANGVGIIDQGYIGEILVPLVKIDDEAPELELPSKLVQLIPRKWIGFTPVEDQSDTASCKIIRWTGLNKT